MRLPMRLPHSSRVVLYNWEDDMPQSVLEAFTQETGIEVLYVTYESVEEAVANLRAWRGL